MYRFYVCFVEAKGRLPLSLPLQSSPIYIGKQVSVVSTAFNPLGEKVLNCFLLQSLMLFPYLKKIYFDITTSFQKYELRNIEM
jgi:hypothetical protein